MSESVIAFVALGSNMGDRLASMRRAVTLLAERDGVFVDLGTDVASLFETAPIGGPAEQGKYLNSAMRVQTRLAAAELMETLLNIERKLGRTRRERWEDRVIDLDLLLLGQMQIESPTLTLPHPRLHERRFVLEPLAEIAPHFVHPAIGRTIGDMAADLRASSLQSVVCVMGPEWATR